MGRNRSPNRDKAFQIYKEKQGKITTKEIAVLLGEKERTVYSWRYLDDWKGKYNPKGGAPKGNKNGKGAPEQNQYARRHGFYSKLMPSEVYDIFEKVDDMSPLEMLWTNIKIKFSAILRSQKIMYVESKEEMIKELKKSKVKNSNRSTAKTSSESTEEEYEFEFQFAWDRQATFLNAQSRAMSELRSLIKQYDEMLHKNWDTATEEQKLRIERLKAQIKNPELQHRKEVASKKLELERERFEHTKKIDESKVW